MRSSMYININITFTFMHISRLILASKSTSFTFFIWIFTNIITFLHGRFVYVHTFFHRQIMCGCRLIAYLYDILQTSYKRRLHRSRVMPPEPIWAEFAPILGNIYPQLIRATTSQQSCHSRLRRATIIYMHIFAGENDDAVIRTQAHEKIRLDFFRAEPLYVLYIAGKNVKNCKVRSCLCALDPSIFHFIWVKHSWKNMAVRAV